MFLEARAPRRLWQTTTPMIFGVQRVVSVEPIFVVSDVPRAVAHYEQLGFSTSHHDEGYAFAHREELTIHLVRQPQLHPDVRQPRPLLVPVEPSAGRSGRSPAAT